MRYIAKVKFVHKGRIYSPGEVVDTESKSTATKKMLKDGFVKEAAEPEVEDDHPIDEEGTDSQEHTKE